MSLLNTSLINCSHIFIYCKCKNCGSPPKMNFYSYAPKVFIDPIESKDFLNKVNRVKYAYVGHIKSGKLFFNIKWFSDPVYMKKYNPRLHKYKGVYPNDRIYEIYVCACGETVWSLNDELYANNREVVQKRSKNYLNHKL